MQPSSKPSLAFLFFLISFGSITAVAYTPALPAISRDFAVSAAEAAWTVSIFLIGYAVGQLLYGPLANRYGRKVALYIGISMEIAGSLLCAFSAYLHTFEVLVSARLLMALGASVGLKMSFTLVADSYSAQQSRRIISHLLAAFAITPAVGIAIGGFLVEHLGWPSCFYFTALYGAGLLYFSWKLPETNKMKDPNALKFKTIMQKYAATLKAVQLPLAAMLMGTVPAIVYVFAALTPFIAINIMHLSPSQYGLWNLVPVAGVLLGSRLSLYFSRKRTPLQVIAFGIIVMIIGIVLMLSGCLGRYADSAIFLFVSTLVIRLGSSCIYPNASTIALSTSEDKSNSAAMTTFISMGVATLCVLGLGFFQTVTALLLAEVFGGIILLAVLLSVALVVFKARALNS